MNTTSIIEASKEEYVEIDFNVYQAQDAYTSRAGVLYNTTITARLGKANGIPARENWMIKYTFDTQELIRLQD